MARFIGRVALLATLAAAVCATFAVAAGARTTDAEGAGRTPGVRTPAAVLALNETETGTAEFVGGGTNCGFVSLDPTSTSVTGSPISDGEFESIHFFDCSTSGPCYSMAAIVLLADSRGEIEKFESGRMCVAEGTSTVTFRFNGTYEIIGGAGAYTNAQGTGAATRTWVCTDPSSCTVSGRESATQEEGPIKKGDDPAHVLLCSPTLVQRADGTMGNALQVPWADYQAWLSDPSSHPEIPTGSIPAKYGDGIGLTCDNLPGYEDSGTKVDEQGLAPSETNGALEGAIYPYWVKA